MQKHFECIPEFHDSMVIKNKKTWISNYGENDVLVRRMFFETNYQR